MTDPYARPADPAGDATIPLIPEEGYAATAEIPFAEDTIVTTPATPAPSPWAPAQAGRTASSYTQPEAGYPQANYTQPEAGYPQTNYAQTAYPPPAAPSRSNYTQPQADYGRPAPSAGYQQGGFAEPSGFPESVPAQNIYQGYPTAQPAPAWPAVVQDPVGYDYGYSRQPAASDHPNAVISLILGILGLVFFQLLSPVAWFLAAKARREMAAQPGRWRPSGALTAGLVLGIIGTMILGLISAAVLFFIVAMMASGI